MSRQKKLLLIVVVLSVFQFLVVPIFDVLDTQFEVLNAQRQKQQKEKALLSLKEQIEAQLAEVEMRLQSLRSSSFKTDSIESGKLQVQKVIEAATKDKNVKLNRINWLEDDSSPGHHTIQISFTASPANYVSLQSELEQNSWLELNKMTYYFSRRGGKLVLIGNVSGILVYDVNFWVSDDAEA